MGCVGVQHVEQWLHCAWITDVAERPGRRLTGGAVPAQDGDQVGYGAALTQLPQAPGDRVDEQRMLGRVLQTPQQRVHRCRAADVGKEFRRVFRGVYVGAFEGPAEAVNILVEPHQRDLGLGQHDESPPAGSGDRTGCGPAARAHRSSPDSAT